MKEGMPTKKNEFDNLEQGVLEATRDDEAHSSSPSQMGVTELKTRKLEVGRRYDQLMQVNIFARVFPCRLLIWFSRSI